MPALNLQYIESEIQTVRKALELQRYLMGANSLARTRMLIFRRFMQYFDRLADLYQLKQQGKNT